MATIHFQNNPLNVQADPDATKLNFRDLGEFDNESVTKPQTGKTGRVTITYKDATVPPRQFKVSQEVTFPDGAVVKISGKYLTYLRLLVRDAHIL